MNKNNYTVAQFEKDLEQLGGMIDGFYSGKGGAQFGGKKKTKARKTKPKKTMAKRKVKKGKRGGAAKRYYKVTKVDGTNYPYYRRYAGAEPKDAALKAFHFICKKLGKGKACMITFELKETTRGSDKRTYGPYKGQYRKLDKPKPVIIKGKKIAVKTHERIVGLVRK
jgi:hypothetical protein